MKKRIKRTADPQPDPEPIFDPAIDDGAALAPGSGEEDDEVPPELFLVPEPPQPKEAQEPQPPKKRRRRSDSPTVAVPREVPEPVAPSVPVEPSLPGPPRRRSTSPTTPEATIPAIPSGPSTGLALAEDIEACSQAGLLGAFSAANSACREVTLTCSMNGAQLLQGRRRALKETVSQVSRGDAAIADKAQEYGYQRRGLMQAVSEECKAAFMESCLSTASQQTTNIKGACKELLLNGPPQPYPGCASFGEVERIFSKGISALCTETLEDFFS